MADLFSGSAHTASTLGLHRRNVRTDYLDPTFSFAEDLTKFVLDGLGVGASVISGEPGGEAAGTQSIVTLTAATIVNYLQVADILMPNASALALLQETFPFGARHETRGA